MASRFYFSDAGSVSGVTPSFDAGWNDTSEALRRSLLAAKSAGESLTIGARIGPWTATAGQQSLDRQFISEPLAAQTISGTFNGQIMTREYNNGDNVDQLIVAVKVINSDGSSVLSTLFARANATTTAEFVNNVSHRNKRIADGDAIGSYGCADGDRLLIEIGYSNSTGAATPEASAKWGAPSGGTDLPEDETQTTDGVGWVEFSDDIGRLFAFTPTGGITLGGSAATLKTSVFTASVSSGATFSGAAATSYEAAAGATYTYSASGGVEFSGAVAIAKTVVPAASGGITFAGSAALARAIVPAVSGGLVFSGTAGIARTTTVYPSGWITLAGASATNTTALYTPTASGGVEFSGAAALAKSYVSLVSSGITFSGAATTSLVPAGSAVEYPYTASSGIEFNGAASTSRVSGTAYEVQHNFLGTYFAAPLIFADPPKPERFTYSYRGLIRLGVGGYAQVTFTPVQIYRYTGLATISKLKWTGTHSRSFAASPGVNLRTLSRVRRQEQADEIALLALA